MDPTTKMLLSPWNWRPDVTLTLLLAGTIYFLGWRRLRQPGQSLARGWRLVSYLGGLLFLALALLSPIDALGSQLFYMHMIQHLLLVMLAPPLLLLANPFPFILWGLPAKVRLGLGRQLNRNSPFRRGLRSATPPGLAWLVFIAIFWGWHDPRAYDAALRLEWVHNLEHLTFFGSALLFWWYVTGASPRLHARSAPGLRIAYLLITVPANMLAGVFITFAGQPLYPYYTAVPRLNGLTVMQDQMLGGVIMWIPGSMMYIIAALVLIAGVVRAEESKPPQPESAWATDEAMLAPGWDK